MLITTCLLVRAAAAQAQPFTEGFDNVAVLSSRGWVLRNNSQPIGTSSWFQGDPAVFFSAHGSPNEYVAADFSSGAGIATISNWLLTPEVSLASGARLSFWTRKGDLNPGGGYPDRLQVRMSTAGAGADVGTTATDVGTFTTLLLDINPTYTETDYPYFWTRFDVIVTGVPTPTFGRFAFRYFVENGGPGGSRSDYIGIDTVEFEPATPATVAPLSITVDSAGNGVLQPNEIAAISPTWQNTSAVAIPSLTGTLGNFMGPIGPNYVIVDSVGGYGAVAPGAAATCSDCYAVTIPTATRPTTHWDTIVQETVSTGPTARTWVLHVGDSFEDLPASNVFYRFVETLLHKGVTGGCSATRYCPVSPTTREQMAVFVLVAREGAGYAPPACGATPTFADVPASSPFCAWIEELARRGVVGGCGSGHYCPGSPVTREQMAIFVLRTLDGTLSPPVCTTPPFADVSTTSPFCRWISELARRNIVTGCGGGNYCPLGAVTREQMGVFISATFGLTLYGP